MYTACFKITEFEEIIFKIFKLANGLKAITAIQKIHYPKKSLILITLKLVYIEYETHYLIS